MKDMEPTGSWWHKWRHCSQGRHRWIIPLRDSMSSIATPTSNRICKDCHISKDGGTPPEIDTDRHRPDRTHGEMIIRYFNGTGWHLDDEGSAVVVDPQPARWGEAEGDIEVAERMKTPIAIVR